MSEAAMTSNGQVSDTHPGHPLNAQNCQDPKRKHGRDLVRLGWGVILVAIVPVSLWITLAPLSMAVVAPGVVKADMNRRPVQHLEGGIIHSVLVRDGQRVEKGDPLLILEDVAVDANQNRVEYRTHLERAAIARLNAEQSRATRLQFPPELVAVGKDDGRVRDAIDKERALFEARYQSLTSELVILSTQRKHVADEMAALRAQIVQLEKAHGLQMEDLSANRRLVEDGFISINRINQIEAGVSDYAAKLEERKSELARAAQRMGDINMRMKGLENAYVQNASDELKNAVARLAELEQEIRKTDDASDRLVVKAPVPGEIIGLKFTSRGAVVRPGEQIAEIVPEEDKLIIEARIRPEEVNHVYPNQKAYIKFSAFKYRHVAMADAKVVHVSADRLTDPATNFPYFSVMVETDDSFFQQVKDFKLQSGIPAEVYIEGSQQTTLQYLLEPVLSTMRRAGREM